MGYRLTQNALQQIFHEIHPKPQNAGKSVSHTISVKRRKQPTS